MYFNENDIKAYKQSNYTKLARRKVLFQSAKWEFLIEFSLHRCFMIVKYINVKNTFALASHKDRTKVQSLELNKQITTNGFVCTWLWVITL